MSGCKMSRVSRELFDNIKSFLHYKLKTMIRIQSVNDLELILKWQDRVLECQSLIALKELNRKLYNQGVRHTIMMQGLFLFFEYFDNRIKLKSLRNLAEEQVIDFLFGLAKNRKPSSMAKYVMVLRQFFDYLDRKRNYSFDFELKNLSFAKNNTTQKTCSLKSFIAKIFKLSNIDVKSYGLGLHLFRHSFATFIYDETQDLVLTSRALGHSSLLSAKIYIHTTQEHNKKVALVLKGLLKNEKSE
ncbi:site-specific integrase [Helicobacter pylori]|nr:site-specific integrase [Helicobacter pylori]